MSRFVATLATLFALLTPHETQALFHLAVIDEVKSGANGNPSIQYVEIRMLSANQTLVAHSRLTVFKCSGDGGGSAVLIADLPANVPNGGPNLRWIMASPSAAVFLAQSGITPDFTWDATVIGSIPTACGMVCWGAPSSTVPPNPPTWDATNPANYTDCVAYGTYDGAPEPAGNPPAGATPGDPTFSLRRADDLMFSNNFTLDCPSPTNNANMMGTFGSCTPPTTTSTSTTSTTTSTTLAFGGDDTGCVPDTKGHLKCGDGLGKAFGKAIRAVIKCHQKQAHAAFAGPPADDEACEEGTGTGKAAKEKLDAAIAKLSPLCSGQQLSGATAEETTLFASKTNPASLDAQNGNVYCDGTTSIDASGDDAGTVDMAAADAKNRLKCADTVGAELGKLAAAVIKCHQKAADAKFAFKPFDEEACEETDPVKHKAAHEKYSAAMDKLDLKGTCTQTCLSRTSRDMLAANVISQIEAANEVAYPCP